MKTAFRTWRHLGSVSGTFAHFPSDFAHMYCVRRKECCIFLTYTGHGVDPLNVVIWPMRCVRVVLLLKTEKYTHHLNSLSREFLATKPFSVLGKSNTEINMVARGLES